MISDLVGTFVRWDAYSARPEDHTTGRGHIRAVYADVREARVARVIVEVTWIGSGDKAAVGDLLDLNIQEVSTRLDPDAAAIRLEDVDLSVRAAHVLQSAGLATLGDVARLTPGELLRTRNLGRKVLNEIVEVLAARGLRLREGG